MTWCNKLASTPSIGFRLDHHFTSGDSILTALSPLTDRWVDGEKPLFSVEKRDQLSVELMTLDGFRYGADSSRIHVAFNHRMKVKHVSGGPPVMEMLSQPLPYTDLVGDCTKRLIEATLLLPGIRSRKVNRVGVVTHTRVAENEAPPGIRRFLSYLRKPWGGNSDSFDIRITAELEKNSNWADRCIHLLQKPDDPEELPTVQFDWQRTYASGRTATEDSLRELLDEANKASLDYFEDLAEGNRFDEQLISSPV